MDREQLKRQIHEFVENTWRDHRPEFIRKELLNFILECLNERTQPMSMTTQQLERIREMVLTLAKNMSLPFFINKQPATETQRITYCYIEAIMSWLYSQGLIQYILNIDTQPPTPYSSVDE